MTLYFQATFPNGSFSLPLSPAESDLSLDNKKDDGLLVVNNNFKQRNKGLFAFFFCKILRFLIFCVLACNNQRYSSDDLYKPRPTFLSSRRRGGKNIEK